MVRGAARPPRPPSRWTPLLVFGLIALGIVAALSLALFPVHSANTRFGSEGCGDAALTVVLNGEGSAVEVGRRSTRLASTGCYRQAEFRLFVAGVLLVAPFATVLIGAHVLRRDPDGARRR